VERGVAYANDEKTSPGKPAWTVVLGMILVPLVVLLVVAEVLGAIAAVSHFAHLRGYPADGNGISSLRREMSLIYYSVLGVIGPLVVALLWFDVVRSGAGKRTRLALIGYVGLAVAGLAALLLLPY
jgi:hypothetical protein